MVELKKNSRPAGDASNLAEKNFQIERLPASSQAANKSAKGSKKKKDKKNKKNKK